MQVVPKVLPLTSFADSFFQHASLIDGRGWDVAGDGGGAPCVLPGTVKGLALYDGSGLGYSLDVVVQKNFVDTALTCGLSSGAAGRQAFDDTNVISFAAGDSLEYRAQHSVFFQSETVGVTAELTANSLLYGWAWPLGTINAGDGRVGAAFGNGVSAGYAFVPSAIAGSITAIPGTISRIGLKRLTTATGGAWRASIIKNGILQDGSGGSSNSLFTLDDTDATYGDTAITVDCVPWDRVSIVVERLTTNIGFTARSIGVGIAFTPAIAGQTQICVGDNTAIPTSGTTWRMQGSPQLGADIDLHTTVMARRSVSFTKMYVEHASPVDNSNTHTMLKNAAGTALTLDLSGGDTQGDVTSLASYVAGDTVTHRLVVNGGTLTNSQLHFALGSGSSIVPDVIGQIGPLAWVHWPRLIP